MRIEETIINIIFDATKGEVAVSSREAVVGKALGELPIPTRAGFAFEGWYLGNELVTTSTVVSSEEDIRLVAHWVKKVGQKKVTMYKKQKIAVAVLSVLTVVLIATLLAVKYFTAIYGLDDIYYGDDGTKYTEKYYVKKDDGVYALFDKDGNRMEMNSDGYYIAKSGNQYFIDPETGEYSLYAVVDYDSDGGEILGFSDRIMMYPQIKQADVNFIEVTNEHGTYKFYRDEEGYVTIAGSEDAVLNYDATLYASLCVSTGYMLTMQKLDMSSSSVPILPDGSIDYSAYGLGENAARFTINGKHLKDTNGDGVIRADEYVNAEYTVLVGDPILSDAGYYVQLEKGVFSTEDGYYDEIPKRAAVYIVSADIKDTVLQPIESMVTPMIVQPITMTQYLMAYNFVLGTANLKESVADPTKTLTPIVAFSFSDLESRFNTIYSTRPYIPLAFDDDAFWARLSMGYNINDNNASSVLGNMYQMEFIGCKKLGIFKRDPKTGELITNSKDQPILDGEVLAKFGLDQDIFYMEYATPRIDAKGQTIIDDKGNQELSLNQLLISQKTPQGTYYVASLACDMIVEVDQYYLAFLEWEKSDWYDQYFFSHNLAYLEGLELIYGDDAYTFTFDNTLSFAFYEKSAGKWSVLDLEKGEVIVTRDQDGKIIDYDYRDKNDVLYTDVRIVDFANKDGFSMEGQKIYYKDSVGKYEITVSSPNLYAYCLQYVKGKTEPSLFDHVDTIPNDYISDSGESKHEDVSTIDNFRTFYQMLLWLTIEGDVDPEEFRNKTGMSMEEYVAQGDDVCQAIIKAQVKDYASVLNQHKDSKGNKTWTEDNERNLVIRFYQYTDWKSLLTIEVIEKFDADGNPISDPTNVACSFYVDADYIDKIADAAAKLLNRELLEKN